jgi:hypothetical protein
MINILVCVCDLKNNKNFEGTKGLKKHITGHKHKEHIKYLNTQCNDILQELNNLKEVENLRIKNAEKDKEIINLKKDIMKTLNKTFNDLKLSIEID